MSPCHLHLHLVTQNTMGIDTPKRRVAAASSQHQQQLRQRQRQEELARQLLPAESTPSVVVHNLQSDMPSLLRRMMLTTLVLAVVAALSLAFALGVRSAASPSPTNASVKHSEAFAQLVPATKTAVAQVTGSLATTNHDHTTNTAAVGPRVQVLAKFPHDSEAFTQGLLVARYGDRKVFVESTGLFGKSTLRQVAIETGEVLARYELPAELFGEGVTLTTSGELVMLTWKSRRGFVLRAEQAAATGASSFRLEREFAFETSTGEGWGIDTDGSGHLVVSDGSASLAFWDPVSMQEVRRVDVTYKGQPVSYLNELEVANGFVYANIWYQRAIVKIDMATGAVVAVFDCAALADAATTGEDPGAVLNGIAYDGDEDAFYVTGKLWNAVYKVRLVE
ncbi:hypothetical protein PybrP1_005936 [[Pythium] brassicae (nom. inval.)]|nr:hypothetical protein PybrP1_005936 [[Pythium] brassicae (nom. inval.)]